MSLSTLFTLVHPCSRTFVHPTPPIGGGQVNKPPDEQWRPVPGFAGAYEINQAGSVRSLERTVIRSDGVRCTVQERILRPRIHPVSGLSMVCLARDGRKHSAYVHRLIADAFSDHSIDGVAS